VGKHLLVSAKTSDGRWNRKKIYFRATNLRPGPWASGAAHRRKLGRACGPGISRSPPNPSGPGPNPMGLVSGPTRGTFRRRNSANTHHGRRLIRGMGLQDNQRVNVGLGPASDRSDFSSPATERGRVNAPLKLSKLGGTRLRQGRANPQDWPSRRLRGM